MTPSEFYREHGFTKTDFMAAKAVVVESLDSQTLSEMFDTGSTSDQMISFLASRGYSQEESHVIVSDYINSRCDSGYGELSSYA